VQQGGDLLERISGIRRQLAQDLGVIVPPIRIRDNVQLKPNLYEVKLKGNVIARYELMLDHLMAKCQVDHPELQVTRGDEGIYGL
jgi:flagellar biosynthesis protein FlhA